MLRFHQREQLSQEEDKGVTFFLSRLLHQAKPPVLPLQSNNQHNVIVKIDGYDQAMADIDECSASGIPSETLYESVRFLDKNARFIYPTLEAKQELRSGGNAYGSWKLQLATGGGRFTTFKPVPIFAFAMIVDETNFGNGIGFKREHNIVLSLLGPHSYNTKIRQMIIGIDDLYLMGGNKVTSQLFGGWNGIGKTSPKITPNRLVSTTRLYNDWCY